MSGQSSSNSSNNLQQSTASSSPLTNDELASYFDKLNQLSGGNLSTYAKNGTAQTDYTPLQSDVTYKAPSNDVTYKAPSADLSYQPVSQDVTYHGVSNDQLKALGGAGATRQVSNDRALQNSLDQIEADPRQSVFQSGYSRLQANREYQTNADAISKEVESALTNAALSQASSDQSGRAAQGSFDTTQAQNTQSAKKDQADFDTTQAQNTQSGKQSQASLNADQLYKVYQALVANRALSSTDLANLAQMFFSGKGQKTSSNSWGFGTTSMPGHRGRCYECFIRRVD